MAANIKLYGLRISYYTGKMEGYLRYKEISHDFVGLNPARMRMLKEATGAAQNFGGMWGNQLRGCSMGDGCGGQMDVVGKVPGGNSLSDELPRLQPMFRLVVTRKMVSPGGFRSGDFTLRFGAVAGAVAA